MNLAPAAVQHVTLRFLAGAALILVYTVCTPGGLPRTEETMPLTITSTAFTDGGEIPSRYTCQGDDISPPLDWRGVPETARSLVLIVDDPDAPDPEAPRMTWVHWVLFNLPTDTTGLTEGITPEDLPPGTGEGMNNWNRTGYGGPCPPIGRHRYFHKLYALDTVLEFSGKPNARMLESAMEGHIIGQAELVGTYRKSR
jgi:Raf kinase inhibitor-like YbhB/YbcL family protein